MTFTIYDTPIEIDDKNLRAFKKMHHTDIDTVDIEMYLDAYYHMSPEQLVKKYSPQELSIIINDSIREEAIVCYNADFYRKV